MPDVEVQDSEPARRQEGVRGSGPVHRRVHAEVGVEVQIGWFRRNHLVSVLELDSLAES